MPIDANIPLQAQVQNPLNALASGYQLGNTIRQQPMVDQMNQQKLDAGKMELDSAKLKQQESIHGMAKTALQADYYGAVQIAPYLASGDMESVTRTINQRKQAKQLIGMPTDTEDNFLAELQSNPEQAKKSVAGMLSIGEKLFGNAKKGTYGALTPAIGPDGKQVFIQSDPSGGQPNVVQGFAPPPTASQEAAALQAQQSAAFAKLLSGGVGAPGASGGGQIPSPNAPAGFTDPFAGLSADEIARLPPDIQKKALESRLDPKRTQEARDAQLSKVEAATKGANAFELIDSVITDPALDASTGLWGMAYRNIPGTQGKRVDANIMRLKGTTFLQGIESIRGMGALSNVEGEKVAAAAAAIDPQMTSEDLRNELVRLRGQVVEGIRNTWVVDNPDIPSNDIDMLLDRPDLAGSFKQMYGRLPRGFERVQGFLKGPQPTGNSATKQSGGSGIKFMGFE